MEESGSGEKLEKTA